MSMRPPNVEFEITTIGGERGNCLAKLQAAAILDVLQWFSDHHRTGPAPTERREDGSTPVGSARDELPVVDL